MIRYKLISLDYGVHGKKYVIKKPKNLIKNGHKQDFLSNLE